MAETGSERDVQTRMQAQISKADGRQPRRWRVPGTNQINSFGTRLNADSGGGEGCRGRMRSERTPCRDEEEKPAKGVCRVGVVGPTLASTAAVLTCSEIASTRSRQHDSGADESELSASSLTPCVCVPIPVDGVHDVLVVARRPGDRRECGERDQDGHQRLAPRGEARQSNEGCAVSRHTNGSIRGRCQRHIDISQTRCRSNASSSRRIAPPQCVVDCLTGAALRVVVDRVAHAPDPTSGSG